MYMKLDLTLELFLPVTTVRSKRYGNNIRKGLIVKEIKINKYLYLSNCVLIISLQLCTSYNICLDFLTS